MHLIFSVDPFTRGYLAKDMFLPCAPYTVAAAQRTCAWSYCFPMGKSIAAAMRKSGLATLKV
jgi:hypothetical protein